MNKIISIRELALLGVLIVLAAYYFVVQGPVAKQTEELQSSRTVLESQISDATEKAIVMNKMQSELDEIQSAADGGVTHLLSNYSNNKVVMQELNVILNAADEFDASFGDVSFADNIMRREISISYKTQSKEAAESIVSSIESSINTYLITGFTTSGDNNNNSWSSSLTLVNYEFVTDEQTEQLGLTEGTENEADNKTATEQLVDDLTNGY